MEATQQKVYVKTIGSLHLLSNISFYEKHASLFELLFSNFI